MSHYNVLMIGTEANLMQIYADCSDSSSETKAEMTFAYDYLCPLGKNFLLGKDTRVYNSEDCEFTKEDTELYNEIIVERRFYDCFDIRDNTSNNRITEELSDKGLDNFFNDLPDDTHFFLCVGHL